MPQTYRVTTSPRAAGTSSPDAVSRTRTSGALPGTLGTNGIGQLLTRRLYPGATDPSGPVGRSAVDRAHGDARTSERRPRDRGPVGAGKGVHAAVEETQDSLGQRVDVALREQREKPLPRLVLGERVSQALQAQQVVLDDRLPGPAPQHGAQLRGRGERHAVVDGPEAPLPVPEAVRALPVGVVEGGVEHGEGPHVV